MSHTPVFRTIREQIADRIRADVISGRLAEGTSLREQALAKQYGVSRAPIRDALLQLTQEGLLVAKPNCGVRVGSPSGEEIQPLVVELRRKIEVFALRKVFSKLIRRNDGFQVWLVAERVDAETSDCGSPTMRGLPLQKEQT